jgi:hypothetical protein
LPFRREDLCLETELASAGPARLRRAFHAHNVTLLGCRERPDFVHLAPLGPQVPDMLIVIGDARLAGRNEELDDGVLARAGQPGNSTNAVTLAEQVKDAGAFVRGQLSHALNI